MKILILLSLTFFTTYNVVAQNCNPPKDNIEGSVKPYKIFKFSNGKTLGFCGTIQKTKKEINYTEFELYICGADTSFLIKDATQTCSIKQIRDTLFIEEYYSIANGKSLSINWTKFYVTKVYWKASKIKQEDYFKTDLKKYSKVEIEKTLNEYKKTKKNNDYDKNLLLGHRLFWAYVSGSKKAGEYLEKF